MSIQVDNRRLTLAKIHIAKKQLGLDDDVYRDRLQQLTGKRSCSEMAIGELFKVLKNLEQCGFKAKRPSKGQANKSQTKRRGRYSPKSQGQPIDVIRALWIQMAQQGMVNDGSELALTAWVKRTTSRINGGIGVDSLEWLALDFTMTGKVINALKAWQKRVLKQWYSQDVELIRQHCTERPELSPRQVVLELLEACRIDYWPEFGLELNIQDHPDQYTGPDRRSAQ